MNDQFETPALPSINATLTGAAKRSADASAARASAWWEGLRAKVATLAAALGVPQDVATAADIATAIRAMDAVRAGGPYTLAPYWSTRAQADLNRAINMEPALQFTSWPLGGSSHAAVTVARAARDRKMSLIAAGVPMAATGEQEAEYWDDAAARGC